MSLKKKKLAKEGGIQAGSEGSSLNRRSRSFSQRTHNSNVLGEDIARVVSGDGNHENLVTAFVQVPRKRRGVTAEYIALMTDWNG